MKPEIFIERGKRKTRLAISMWNTHLKPKAFLLRSVVENDVKGYRIWRYK